MQSDTSASGAHDTTDFSNAAFTYNHMTVLFIIYKVV